MCGISGYISKHSVSDIQILKEMTATLSYRGPDDRGAKIYESAGKQIGLGQSRLSIIDLSPAGHQPMEYRDLAIVFNGEIYNYKEIRSELENLNHKFFSNSDTEVILHAFKEWGVNSVHKFIGMFAFSLLDLVENKVYFFRDRAGVKPFYYYVKDELFLFASELKSLHKHPSFEKQLDISSFKLFFDYGYIPAPYSIFKNCSKLEAGNYIVYDLKTSVIKIEQYWNVKDYYSKPKLEIDYKEAKDNVHNLFKSAFNYRMVSDVPVGVFLSGGYDSTAVTAILQQDRQDKLKTFTIGCKEGNNEAPYAKDMASYLGTDHTEYYFSSKEAQEIIPELPYYYDEPFFDSSALPTIMVSRLAKKSVTVALSADGGDEIFAGYNSYRSLERRLNTINKVPDNFKGLTSNILKVASKLYPQGKVATIHSLEGLAYSLNRDKLKQTRRLFHKTHMLPQIYNNKLFISNAQRHKNTFDDIELDSLNNPLDLVMCIDYKMYLQNDILTKVDRATMSVSLEGREPLLDHRIIEFVAQLPISYKFDGIISKKILKDIVHEYVPEDMMNRPKTGFSIPIYSWLRGDLSFLLDEYLNKESLIASNVFNVDFVLHKVKLFKEGKLHYVNLIWKILVYQMWYKKWLSE